MNTAGGAHHHVHAALQFLNVVTHVGAADAGMTLRSQVVTQSKHYFLDLQQRMKQVNLESKKI